VPFPSRFGLLIGRAHLNFGTPCASVTSFCDVLWQSVANVMALLP
jgi:hypothetical protein